MDNSNFLALVRSLEDNPEALHAFLCEDCRHPILDDLLDAEARNFAISLSPERRLDIALFKDEKDAMALRDAIAQCGPNSCDATCGNVTCAVTAHLTDVGSRLDNLGRVYQEFRGACGPDTTCSCTTATCGGSTCGGSTCSVTCTADSCGNTCGDSCGYTTNISNPIDLEAIRFRYQRWR